MTEEMGYSIGQLANEAGVTPRVIRYYVEERLLPPPDRRGRYATYALPNLHRLRLIAKLKRAFLPLSAIREQLRGLTDAQVESLVAESAEAKPEREIEAFRVGVQLAEPHSALSDTEYISQILAITGQGGRVNGREGQSPPKRVLLVSSVAVRESETPISSTWERVEVAEGMELHIRATQGCLTAAQRERLVSEVRSACERIFNE